MKTARYMKHRTHTAAIILIVHTASRFARLHKMRAYVIRKIAVSGTVFIDKIIRKLGASDLLFPYCREYLFVLLLFTPAGILQVLFQNLIVTAGRPGIGMALGVSAGIANILLDYIFMAPLQMGIRGAALGTGIGYMIPAAAGILFFSAGKSSLRFFPSCAPSG